MDADVHLGHHRQAQGRDAQPPGGRAAVAGHRDRARPRTAATGRCSSCRCAMPTRSNFFGSFAYCGAATTVYSRKSFDPEHAVRTLAEGGSTFTSLVPTHYIMMLGLPERRAGARHDLGRVTKLMISSAPARQDTKRGVMAMFPQFRPVRALRLERGRLGHHAPPARAVHQAGLGRPRMRRLARRSRILDEAGNEVPDGEPGELYSCNPYTFDGYWKLPEKTAGGLPRRLLHGRRHGAPRRGRLHPSRRPQEQHDHLRRREHLPVRGRGRARQPPGGPGRGGGRAARRQVGRARPRRRGPARRRTRRARPSCSTGAGTASPATSARAPAAFSRDEEMPRTATGKIQHRILKTRLSAAEEGRDP